MEEIVKIEFQPDSSLYIRTKDRMFCPNFPMEDDIVVTTNETIMTFRTFNYFYNKQIHKIDIKALITTIQTRKGTEIEFDGRKWKCINYVYNNKKSN